MISVITVSNRYGGVDINWSSLRKQTYKDFEWVFCDTLYEKRKREVNKYAQGDPRVVHIKQSPKDPKAKTWLNHAENEAIRVSKGEIIVFLQDYIHIRPDALEKFYLQYKNNNKRMVTGVGHQYARPGKKDIYNPKGLITVFKKPFEDRPEVICWIDPRVDYNKPSFIPCRPMDIEFNFCMLPRQAIVDVGGCDEEYDYIGHAWDNCSVCERADMLDYESYMDQSNISYSVRHDDFADKSVKDNQWQDISQYHLNKMQRIRQKEIDINLGYIDK